MTYKLSAKASEDIQSIWLYTVENWSLEQADRYVNLNFLHVKHKIFGEPFYISFYNML